MTTLADAVYFPVLDSERKRNRGRTTRRHRRSGRNEFFNDLGGLRLGTNTALLEKLGEIVFGAVLPDQLTWHDHKWTAEQWLMAAVLKDAVDVYCVSLKVRGPRAQHLGREAELWLLSHERDWPFSFVNICEALGLDAEYVRKGIFAKAKKEAA